MDPNTVVTLTVCFFEATILGDSLFGWPSLVYVLQEDNLYDAVCQGDNTYNSSSRYTNTSDEQITATASQLTAAANQLTATSSQITARAEQATATAKQPTATTKQPTATTKQLTATVSQLTATGKPLTATAEQLTAKTKQPTATAEQPTATAEQLTANSGRCLKQKELLSEPFTVATVTFGISALPVGLFFDRFGLKVTRTIAMVIGLMSYVQLAFASQGTEWLLMTAAVCIGLSCFALVMTSCHVAQLAGPRTATVTALYMGGVESSFAFQGVKIAYHFGVPRFYSLLFIASLWCLVLFSSWCLLPAFKVSMESPKDSNSEDNNKEIFHKDILSPTETQIQECEEPSQTAKDFIISPNFILFLYWFCALHVRICMMTAGYNAWIAGVLKGDISKVSFFTDLMAYANIFGAFPSALVGIITDRLRKTAGPHPSGTQLALVPAILLTTLLPLCMTIPLLCSTELAIIFAVLLYVVGKPYVYSTASSFMTLLCPAEHFGLVYGVLYFVSGIAAFAIYPYLIWVTHTGTFYQVNILMLVTLLLSLALPVWLVYNSRRLQKENDQEAKPLIKHAKD